MVNCFSLRVLRLPILHALSFAILSDHPVSATSRTIAIDDTYGDAVTGIIPIYNPPTKWIQGQPCTSGDICLAYPDTKQAWNGTWHDSVGITDDAPPRTVDLSFEGNSISIYCIISQVDRAETAVANMSFELDGTFVGRFFHDPESEVATNAGNHGVQYNVAVYQNTSIGQGYHTMRIISIGISRMLFDYALYTTESVAQSTTYPSLPPAGAIPIEAHVENVVARRSSTTQPQIGVIVGAVVGGAVALIAFIVLAFVLLRRRRRSSKNPRHVNIISDEDWRVCGKHDSPSESRSIMSSTDSITLENDRPSTPSFPFNNYSDPFLSPLSISRTNGHFGSHIDNSDNVSPTDSIPVVEFPASSPSISPPIPRIVVSGAETHLIGPDNSMTRFARQQMVEREAELTRHMGEAETALVAKYGAPLPSVKGASLSIGSSSDPGEKLTLGLSSIGSEVDLKNEARRA